MPSIHEFTPWPDSETGTADQLARAHSVQVLWSHGVVEASHTRPTHEFQSAINTLVNSYTVARLLRELALVDPDRANTVTRELLEAYDLAPAPLWEAQAWLAEYGLDPIEVKEAGTKAAREEHDRKPA